MKIGKIINIRRIILLFFLSLFISCTQITSYVKEEYQVIQVETTTGYKMHSFGELYFGPQPSSKDMIALREEGFRTIINLRKNGEKRGRYLESASRNSAALADLQYYNIPFSLKEDHLNQSFINNINSISIKRLSFGKVLIHSASGEVAAMWLGANLFLNKNKPIDYAVKTAKEIGLTHDQLILRLSSYLKKENKK